jgi:HlyD family secretion protein
MVPLLGCVTLGLSRLQPAAPVVDRASIWTDTVKRGGMLRQVRGNGTLVPEDMRWIPTLSAGVVERILVLPGAAVRSNTVLMVLGNRELEQNVFEVASQVKAARADLDNLRVQLDSQKLTQQAAVATAQANHTMAKAESDANEELGRDGLVAAITVKQSKVRTEQLARLLEIEQERLKLSAAAVEAQLAAQEAKIAQLTGLHELKRQHIEALTIRANMEGVLQRLGDSTTQLQVGQQLPAGAVVARIASQTRLKAAIKIAETQARDILLNQAAEIDTHNGIIPGRVIRIDPAVESGTVTVDVTLDGPLPRGARPDLSVDGTILLEKLEDVLFVGRPVHGQSDGDLTLFKLVNQGTEAVHVPVKLGRSSVSMIEIREGLQAGDQVILSDMSQWDAHDRIRLR